MTSVLVTRPGAATDPVTKALRAHGLHVHAAPTVAIEPLDDLTDLDGALGDLPRYDWLVVTSATGACVLATRLAVRGAVLSGRPQVAAVGPATAAALRAHGLPVDAVPAGANGAAVAAELQRRWATPPLATPRTATPPWATPAGARVLLVRADAAARDLPQLLAAAGAVVTDVAAYRTVEGPPAGARAVAAALDDPELAAVVVASGSAVRGLVELAADRSELLPRLPLVSIGPRTTAAAHAAGLTVVHEADSPSAADLVAAVLSVIGTPGLHDASPTAVA